LHETQLGKRQRGLPHSAPSAAREDGVPSPLPSFVPPLIRICCSRNQRSRVRPDFAVIFIEDCNTAGSYQKEQVEKMKTAGLTHASYSFAAMVAAGGLAWAACFMSAPAAAQSRGTPEQQQACQPDAMRLCSEFVPDVDRITACMIKNRMRLSPACHAVFTAPHKEKAFKHD
jgi:hypothetical protein